ncbi:MAG: hydroxymethylglutaryl-CoA lyase [Desulfosarcinaceae bacterium]|nr:hydroxymethylglutaryl-CoA lyase [Desulfosarcinaceae bacterium]
MQIVEVGPRDGLQNESAHVPTAIKIALVNDLAAAGVAEVEVSAFVSPDWVPQLADADAVFQGIARRDGVIYSALVPNQKGLARALKVGVDKVSVFTAASETFNQKNINTSIDGSLHRIAPVVTTARAAGLPVRGYLSTAFWCAFEGAIPPQRVVDLAERLVALGVDEVAVSDTIGKATPDEVEHLLDLLLARLPVDRIALHFHDTYGHGVDNVLAAKRYGITIFDASVGGLGGCPYAPGAAGNVATQAVVNALAAAGAPVAVDCDQLNHAESLLAPYLVDERRQMPAEDAHVCARCQFSTGEECCERYRTSA